MTNNQDELGTVIEDILKDKGWDAVGKIIKLFDELYKVKLEEADAKLILRLSKELKTNKTVEQYLNNYFKCLDKSKAIGVVNIVYDKASIIKDFSEVLSNIVTIERNINNISEDDASGAVSVLASSFSIISTILDYIPNQELLSAQFEIASDITKIAGAMVKQRVKMYEDLYVLLYEVNYGATTLEENKFINDIYNAMHEYEQNNYGDRINECNQLISEYGWLFKLSGIDLSEYQQQLKLINEIKDYYDENYKLLSQMDSMDKDKNGIIVNSEIEMETDGWNKSEKSQKFDPLILDLNKNNKFTSTTENGTYFDFAGDGLAEKTAWLDNGDGLLVLDRNGNGLVDDGKELFGDKTILEDGSISPYGFAALSEIDTNDDGVINSFDEEFANLKVWIDENNDGISQEGELHKLSELGIVEIGVNYTKTNITEETGNYISRKSKVTFADGSQTALGELNFIVDTTDTVLKNDIDVPEEISKR